MGGDGVDIDGGSGNRVMASLIGTNSNGPQKLRYLNPGPRRPHSTARQKEHRGR